MGYSLFGEGSAACQVDDVGECSKGATRWGPAA